MEKIQYRELAEILDSGINDVENNRELPIDDAFDLIDKLIKEEYSLRCTP